MYKTQHYKIVSMHSFLTKAKPRYLLKFSHPWQASYFSGVNDREESVRVKALECLVGAFSSTKDWLYQMASREEANIRNSSYEKRESGHNTSVDYGIAYKSFS
jgi:hypothetical protein